MRWITPHPIIVPDSLQAYYARSPYLAEALVKKGITTADQAIPFLDYTCYSPTDPYELPGVETATQRLLQALSKKERIGIWGDFDVDGQTSTALLVNFFRTIQLPVQYHIPIREEESHGILKTPLEHFLRQGVDVLVTCDTGISAHEALEFATQQGVDVIITDHHTPPKQLPAVLVAINPHFVDAEHAFHNLSGVGTAFILTRALAAELDMLDEWQESVLDLVALGTIADVAPLLHENRYMVQYGLDLLHRRPRLAIQEMLRTAEVPLDSVDEQTVSFTLAPRMNARGRLGDANPMVNFLLTDDLMLARRTAAELEGLNNQRKMLVNQVYQAAVSQIEKDPAFKEKSIIILANPAWPAGILGIVANHLCDTYGKPAILLSKDRHDMLKGSARSIPGIDITQQLEAHSDLLVSYGGHAMAAGMALHQQQFDSFVQQLNSSIASIVGVGEIEATLPIDAYLPLAGVDESFVQSMEKLAPYGAGNPAPTFLAEHLHIAGFRYLDRDKVHRSIQVTSAAGQHYEVKWWHAFDTPLPSGEIDLAYTIRRSTFRGASSLELGWVDARERQPESIAITEKEPGITILDHRHLNNSLPDLLQVCSSGKALCWGEHITIAQVQAHNRLELEPHSLLVLLHMPPHATVLRSILAIVQPHTMALFNLPQEAMNPRIFLQTLVGMLKYALREKQGIISPEQYAAMLGVPSSMIEIGLHLLQAGGQIKVEVRGKEKRIISTGDTLPDMSARVHWQTLLLQAFSEMAAFQRFLLRLSPEQILQDYGTTQTNN
ncbi:MAG: single-stranded-DNA-specific exonuclease RecJ [Chloroflexi bacterium]|nr:single-stranded-DNA-specific exonuclease RecJ [Chloroflexota bacterium]